MFLPGQHVRFRLSSGIYNQNFVNSHDTFLSEIKKLVSDVLDQTAVKKKRQHRDYLFNCLLIENKGFLPPMKNVLTYKLRGEFLNAKLNLQTKS